MKPIENKLASAGMQKSVYHFSGGFQGSRVHCEAHHACFSLPPKDRRGKEKNKPVSGRRDPSVHLAARYFDARNPWDYHLADAHICEHAKVCARAQGSEGGPRFSLQPHTSPRLWVCRLTYFLSVNPDVALRARVKDYPHGSRCQDPSISPQPCQQRMLVFYYTWGLT